MAYIDLKKCTVTITDGTSTTPLSITVKIGDGNITWDETRNIEYKKDRGLLDTAREGDQEPVDVSMDFAWIFVKGDSGDSAPVSIHDAIKGVGSASAWKSSATGDVCAPYAVTITVLYTPCTGGGKTETYILTDYRWEKLNYDPKAGMIKTSGKCNINAIGGVRT